jgi:hypothetical protein
MEGAPFSGSLFVPGGEGGIARNPLRWIPRPSLQSGPPLKSVAASHEAVLRGRTSGFSPATFPETKMPHARGIFISGGEGGIVIVSPYGDPIIPRSGSAGPPQKITAASQNAVRFGRTSGFVHTPAAPTKEAPGAAVEYRRSQGGIVIVSPYGDPIIPRSTSAGPLRRIGAASQNAVRFGAIRRPSALTCFSG